MLKHDELNKVLIDYSIKELKYNKDCHTNYSYDDSGFKFTFGEFRDSPVLPKNAILIGVLDKSVAVSKVINFTKNSREIICFLNYSDKTIDKSNENIVDILKSIKEAIKKINFTLESESEIIESSKEAIEEIFTDQNKVGIPLLNINISDDNSPAISYTVIPTNVQS